MQLELTNKRKLVYSNWHRAPSLGRFVPNAHRLYMYDLDAVEFDAETKEPVALIETAEYRGHFIKNTNLLIRIAQKANLPFFVVFYKISESLNPDGSGHPDIDYFYIKRAWPDATDYRRVSPSSYAKWLARLRGSLTS